MCAKSPPLSVHWRLLLAVCVCCLAAWGCDAFLSCLHERAHEFYTSEAETLYRGRQLLLASRDAARTSSVRVGYGRICKALFVRRTEAPEKISP